MSKYNYAVVDFDPSTTDRWDSLITAGVWAILYQVIAKGDV